MVYRCRGRTFSHFPHLLAGKDIFNLDKIFFPVNVGRTHWVVTVAYMQEKRIQFYDSFGDSGNEWMEAVFRYIKDEHMDKKKSPLPDEDSWELVPCVRGTPRQLNGANGLGEGTVLPARMVSDIVCFFDCFRLRLWRLHVHVLRLPFERLSASVQSRSHHAMSRTYLPFDFERSGNSLTPLTQTNRKFFVVCTVYLSSV